MSNLLGNEFKSARIHTPAASWISDGVLPMKSVNVGCRCPRADKDNQTRQTATHHPLGPPLTAGGKFTIQAVLSAEQ
jgi:hypothetical protein